MSDSVEEIILLPIMCSLCTSVAHPKKSGRGRLCVAVVIVFRVTWLLHGSVERTLIGWNAAGATYKMAVPIRLLRLTSTGNRLWRNICSVYLVFSYVPFGWEVSRSLDFEHKHLYLTIFGELHRKRLTMKLRNWRRRLLDLQSKKYPDENAIEYRRYLK